MSAAVTTNEATTINDFFRAVRVAKELTAASSMRRLTSGERRQLLDADYQRAALRPVVAAINTRTLSNNNKQAA